MTPNERVEDRGPGGASPAPERWTLRLYVAGRTPRDVNAFRNLRRVCDENLPGRYDIEVVNLRVADDGLQRSVRSVTTAQRA